MLTTLVSVWTWLVLLVTILLWLPLMALVRLCTLGDPTRRATGRLFRWIGIVTAKACPVWHFRAEGTLPAVPGPPYVVVANHESFADIHLISHLPWEMKWLAKEELFRLPVLGWLLRLAGDVPVRRGTARSAIEAMQRCREILAQGMSVMIFPEGTRSKDGTLLPFKDGAFRLAIDAQVPVLPLVVSGTREALEKHSWRFRPSRAVVRVLEPVSVTGLTTKDVPELRDRVRDLIAQARAAMEPGATAPLGAPMTTVA